MSSVGLGLANVSMKKPVLTAAGPEMSILQSKQPTDLEGDEVPTGYEPERVARCSYSSWTVQSPNGPASAPNRQTHEDWCRALENTLSLIEQNQRLGIHT